MNFQKKPHLKPSKIKQNTTILRLSIQNIWRNKVLSLTTVFVMAIILFMLNIILSINFLAENAMEAIGEKIDIVVYLKDSAPESDILKLARDLGEVEGVKHISYTSKEKALKDLQKSHPDLTLAFEKYGIENPLPKSLNITITNPKYYDSINTYLQNPKFFNILSQTDQRKEDRNLINAISQNLSSLSLFAKQVLFWTIITFIIGGSLIMVNAIQVTIFSRRQEIEVMKMVGASHSFIRLPFIIESAVYGTMAVLVCFFMLFLLSQNPTIKESEILHLYPTINIYALFGMELAGTLFLSIISASLAVREHI